MKVVGFSGEVQTFDIIGNPKKIRECAKQGKDGSRSYQPITLVSAGYCKRKKKYRQR